MIYLVGGVRLRGAGLGFMQVVGVRIPTCSGQNLCLIELYLMNLMFTNSRILFIGCTR